MEWTLLIVIAALTVGWLFDYGKKHQFKYLKHNKKQGRAVL